MNNIAILGAGFSTAVLCHYLNEKDVVIFEKARGPGGRSSTRKVDDIGVFDHGLQYISPKDKQFSEFLKKNKSIKQWDGDFVEIDGKITVLPPSEKLIGRTGNNDFVKSYIHLEQCHFKTRIEKIEFLNDHWRLIDDSSKEHLAKQVILTLPQEQTNELVKDLDIGFEIKENIMKPCFTVMLGLKESPIFRHSGYVLNNPIVSWCANETSKQRELNNKDLTLLTLQTTEEYGFNNFKKYRENKDQILNEIVSEFLDIFKIDEIEVVHKQVHGWLYAYSDPVNTEVFYNKEKGIGITGDWFTGGRAENSWNNAKLLVEKLDK
jgi:renalase